MDNNKRVFLIVLDSVGIGELPDADNFGDVGSNTLKTASRGKNFSLPNLTRLGLFNIDGMDWGKGCENPIGAYARLAEASNGKDTTIGHWEIGGVISTTPLPTYPNGFPDDFIEKFTAECGRGVLCNKPYSGTLLLQDFGREHMESGKLIVYTSADSVFQIAAHESVVPLEELYRYCEIARELLQGEHAVGRVIARPFVGKYPEYIRTANRRDFSLEPPKRTMLDILSESAHECIGVGKIYDIFAGRGVTQKLKTKNNEDGIKKTIELMGEDFSGLCFINLVDFDMLYGHRNDIEGYARALTEFDGALEEINDELDNDDLIIITADHGCDPGTESTDHSREYVPMLAYSKEMKSGKNLGTRSTFADIAATVLDFFDIQAKVDGQSFLSDIFFEEER